MRGKMALLLLIGAVLLALLVVILDYSFSERLHGHVTEIQEDGRILIKGKDRTGDHESWVVTMPTSKEFEIGDELTVWIKNGATTAKYPGEGKAKRFYIEHN